MTTSFFMSSFFYYVNPKSSTEERATHTHTQRLTTSPEKAQNKRLSPKIIPKVPQSKLSKTMSTILLTDNTEKKKKKKHHQYRCKNTTVDQKDLKLCVCVYMWVYVCTSLPWPKLARSSFFLSQQPLYRRIRDCPNTYTFLTKEKPNYSSPTPPKKGKKRFTSSSSSSFSSSSSSVVVAHEPVHSTKIEEEEEEEVQSTPL